MNVFSWACLAVDLLVAPPAQPLQELMETDIVTVHPDADPVRRRDYGEVQLAGRACSECRRRPRSIVTVDDALDVLLPRNAAASRRGCTDTIFTVKSSF